MITIRITYIRIKNNQKQKQKKLKKKKNFHQLLLPKLLVSTHLPQTG